jgi:alpha-tubulin suppressor-like RCC1 family protein
LGNGYGTEEKQEIKYVEDPFEIALGLSLKVIKIVCGAGHSLILTHMNQLFSWGGNLLG